MSQKEIRKITGENAPRIEIDNIMEEIREYRSGMIFTYKNKKLLDITFSMNVELYLFDIEIFKEENLLKKIKKHDTPTTEGKNGYLNFYKYRNMYGRIWKKENT